MTLLLLLACTGPSADDTGGAATIAILSPADESTVCGFPLLVETKVENFVLVEPFPEGSTEAPPPGTGHIDVALNGQEYGDWMFGGETLPLYGADGAAVPDGYYQLRVELSNADHTPIEPYAGDLVYVTVDAAVCD